MSVQEHREQIRTYLIANGPTGASEIEKATGLTKGKVWHALKCDWFFQSADSRWRATQNTTADTMLHALKAVLNDVLSLDGGCLTVSVLLQVKAAIKQAEGK